MQRRGNVECEGQVDQFSQLSRGGPIAGARPTNDISIEFDQNLQCCGLKYTLPITTKFSTCHDSYTVVTNAKFRCDQLSIYFKLERAKFWSNFEFDRHSVRGTGAMYTLPVSLQYWGCPNHVQIHYNYRRLPCRTNFGITASHNSIVIYMALYE